MPVSPGYLSFSDLICANELVRPGTFGFLKVTGLTHREQSMSGRKRRIEEMM